MPFYVFLINKWVDDFKTKRPSGSFAFFIWQIYQHQIQSVWTGPYVGILLNNGVERQTYTQKNSCSQTNNYLCNSNSLTRHKTLQL